MNAPRQPAHALRALLERLAPKQRQYAMLGAIIAGGVGILWLIFAFTGAGARNGEARTAAGQPGTVTNIGVMARDPAWLPYIRAALTPEAVGHWMRHKFKGGAGKVERFDLPGIAGLNFLLHEALGGGGAASMRVDMLAKGKAQQLLDKTIRIPARLAG